MQETFVNLIRSKHRITRISPSSFLYRIATNICLNMIRSEQRGSEAPLAVDIATTDLASSWSSRNLLGRIFSDNENAAYVACLYHLDGMTLEEIAGETGLSVSGVRKQLKRIQTRALTLRDKP